MKENLPDNDEIRKLFINGGKPQFECLKFIFSDAELKSEKSFVLLSMVYIRLQLDKSAFKPKSFRQWVKRYRERTLTKVIQEKDERISVPEISAAPSESSAFKFTDPSTVKKENGQILQFVQ